MLKEVRQLEFKLDKSNLRYNKTVARNNELVEEIDKLRRERKIFQSVYSKLSEDIEEKKQEMDKIVKIANNATSEREKASNQLQELITRAEEEKAAFDQQIQAVNLKIEKEKQMKEYMRAKEEE